MSPIYSYQCESCSAIFEEFWMSFKEVEENEHKYIDESKCPECGSVKKHKTMSSPMIEFKGEGWTNKTISSTSGNRKDSTEALKDHSQKIKEEVKGLKSKDLYGDTSGIMKEGH